MAMNDFAGRVGQRARLSLHLPRVATVLGLACVFLTMLADPRSASAGSKEKTFSVPADVLFESAVRIAKEHHKLVYADSHSLTFAFTTGVSASSFGFNVKAEVQAVSPNQARIVLDITNADSRQVFAWGGGGRSADQFFKWIAEDVRAWYPVTFEIVLVKPYERLDATFEDANVRITFALDRKRVAFALNNMADAPIKIDWNQCSYVDPSGSSHKVIHKDTAFINRDNQSPTIIPPTAGLQDAIVPVDNIQESNVHGGLTINDLFPSGASASSLVGAKFGVFLPIQMENATKNYFFQFAIKAVRRAS